MNTEKADFQNLVFERRCYNSQKPQVSNYWEMNHRRLQECDLDIHVSLLYIPLPRFANSQFAYEVFIPGLFTSLAVCSIRACPIIDWPL